MAVVWGGGRDGARRRSGSRKIRGSGRWWGGMTPCRPGGCETGGARLCLLFLPDRGGRACSRKPCSQGCREKRGAFDLLTETPSLSLLSASALRGHCSDSFISAAWLLFGRCTFAFQAVSSAFGGRFERLGANAAWVADFLVQIPVFSCVPVLFSSVPPV